MLCINTEHLWTTTIIKGEDMFMLQLPCCSCFCFIKRKKGRSKEKEPKGKWSFLRAVENGQWWFLRFHCQWSVCFCVNCKLDCSVFCYMLLSRARRHKGKLTKNNSWKMKRRKHWICLRPKTPLPFLGLNFCFYYSK